MMMNHQILKSRTNVKLNFDILMASYTRPSTLFFLFFSGRGPNGEAVLHVSYNDGECGEKWGELLKLPKATVDREIHRALEYKFKRTIPQPLSTVYQYWDEGAW